MSYWLVLVMWLGVLHLALTENLKGNNLIAAVVVASLLVLMLRPPRYGVALWRLPVALLSLVWYVVQLLWAVWQSGIGVARIVLNPKLPIDPGIIAIPTQSPRRWVTAISAHSITVTPGELVVEIGEDGTMYTHALSCNQSADVAVESQAKRANMLERIIL